MVNYIQATNDQLRELILSAVGRAVAAGELAKEPIPAFTIQIPADKSHGDFAANVAMVSAKAFRLPPRKIAETISAHIIFDGTYFVRSEIAGPGFLNFFLSERWFADALGAVMDKPEQYGRTDAGNGQKIMVEFVSANPTGPMHIGNARGGVIGDSLASVLDWAGYDVTKEFYINDAGNQIEKFAISLEARYLQLYKGEDTVPFPEDAYHGTDITEHAKAFAEINGDKYVAASSEERKKALADYALPLNIEGLKRDLARYGIHYDVWFSESSLHESGAVQEAVDKLTANGYTYEKEGALWYKATEFGAEKDDVLIRANGTPTYFAADIAYHYNKFAVRGFKKVVNIWGADHHGHVARLQHALDAIGLNGNDLEVVLMQMVRLMRNGETVKLSKRTGKTLTLTDLLDEIPVDAARFFFNLREANTHCDFDLDLAVEQSSTNPVYYVQYAHARICSIFRKLEQDGISLRAVTTDELLKLNTPEEIELIRYIACFPQEIAGAAQTRDPSTMTKYAHELASLFHKFYNVCRVQSDDESLMQARMNLCAATRTVLRNTFLILGISAPDSM